MTNFATKAVVVLSILCASVSAVPHDVRSSHNQHRALAHAIARNPAPEPLVAAPASPLRRRALSKRCSTRAGPAPTSSAVVSSSVAAPTSSAVVTSSVVPVVNVAPDPATTAAPVTTETYAPAAPTTSAAAPAPPASSPGGNAGGFLAGSNVGQVTFYATGLGACGITNNDHDMIAAASHLLFDSYPGYDGVNPNKNPLCNKMVVVNLNGKSVNVAITDRCEACAMTDLDLSPDAFAKLADFGVGRASGMTWSWA